MNNNSKKNKHSKSANGSSNVAFKKGSKDIATAPYNFVRLTYNKEGNRDGSPIFTESADDSNSELYSGTITCRLKALTPIMVAGPSNRNDKKEVRKFIEVDGNKIIPGSSIKGMFRSYLEAFSCLSMPKVMDAYIYWRNITGGLAGSYKSNFETTPKGGYIKKEGARYRFYKADIEPVLLNQKGIYKTGPIPNKKKGYIFGKAKSEDTELLEDEIINRFLEKVAPPENKENLKDTHPYKIWEKEYEALQRGDFARVFCIYHKNGEKKDKVKELGIARYLKIPYPMTPAQMAGDTLTNDFCAQLFGYINDGNIDKKSKKGRISFSCCKLNNAQELEVKRLVLSSPKPTCVQHYIDQHIIERDIPQKYFDNNKDKKADSLKNYSKGNSLRGRKFYWHRKTELLSDTQASDDVITSFIPVNTGAEGTFRINLYSVNEIELGAILELLKIPEKSAFKIGMAKPYGYGSIQISINKIEIEKESSRYLSLSRRLSNKVEEFTEDKISSFINNFEEFVFKSVNNGECNSYNELQSILDLREMMCFKEKSYNQLMDKDWESLTSYMASPTDKNSHPSFNDKKILPYPEHVKKFRWVLAK